MDKVKQIAEVIHEWTLTSPAACEGAAKEIINLMERSTGRDYFNPIFFWPFWVVRQRLTKQSKGD